VQDRAEKDREDRGTSTDPGARDAAQGDDEAREERVEELAQQMNVANNCSPPRPGDPEY
jgi:hypothetical protein